MYWIHNCPEVYGPVASELRAKEYAAEFARGLVAKRTAVLSKFPMLEGLALERPVIELEVTNGFPTCDRGHDVYSIDEMKA